MAEANLGCGTEVWKPVVGFEGRYEASSFGRVKSLARLVPTPRAGGVRMLHRKERLLRPSRQPDGYQHVTFSLEGKHYTRSVHRVVCEAFHGARPAGMTVAHGNGRRHDNRASNLRWASLRDNLGDRKAHGTLPWGERHHASRLTEQQVNEIRASPLSASKMAAMMGMAKCTIQNIRNRRIWKHLP